MKTKHENNKKNLNIEKVSTIEIEGLLEGEMIQLKGGKKQEQSLDDACKCIVLAFT